MPKWRPRRIRVCHHVFRLGESRNAGIARTGATLNVTPDCLSRVVPSRGRLFPSVRLLPADGPGYLRRCNDTGCRVTGRLDRAATLSRGGSRLPSELWACGTDAGDAQGTTRATTSGPDNRLGAVHKTHQ